MPSETRNDGNKKAALEPFFYLSISLSFLKLLNFGVEVFNDYLEQFHIALQLVYFALWGKRFREHGVTHRLKP